MNQTIHHAKCDKTPTYDNADQELKSIFKNLLSKYQLDSEELDWNSDDSVELGNLPPRLIHEFNLEAERLGKEIFYQKRTTISIR